MLIVPAQISICIITRIVHLHTEGSWISMQGGGETVSVIGSLSIGVANFTPFIEVSLEAQVPIARLSDLLVIFL